MLDRAIAYFLHDLTPSLYKKGEKLYLETYHSLFPEKTDEASWEFFIPDLTSDIDCLVSITLDRRGFLQGQCDCLSYYKTSCCSHIVAAVLYLKDSGEDIPTAQDEEPAMRLFIPKVVEEDGYAAFKMEKIHLWQVYEMAGHPRQLSVSKLMQKTRVVDSRSAHHKLQYTENKKAVFDIDIIYDGRDGFKTKCSCGQTSTPLCGHIYAAFVMLEVNSGENYFQRFRDFSEEKAKILQNYGLGLDDEEAEHFVWDIDYWGNLKLSKAPSYLRPKGDFSFINNVRSKLIRDGGEGLDVIRPKLRPDTFVDYEVGLLLNFTSRKHIGFELEPIFVREKNRRKSFKRMSLSNEANWSFLQPLSEEMFRKIIRFSDKYIVDWLCRFVSPSLRSYANPFTQLHTSDYLGRLRSHYLDLLKQIWQDLENWPELYVLSSGNFSNAALSPARLSSVVPKPVFAATSRGNFIEVSAMIEIEGRSGSVRIWSHMILENDQTYYLPESLDDIDLLRQFPEGFVRFHISDRLEVIKNLILPLQKKYRVICGEGLEFDEVRAEPLQRIHLSELNGEFLLIKPQFQYEDVLLDYDDQTEHVDVSGDRLKIIYRDKAKEKQIYEFLRELHPKFSNQRNNLYYHLRFDEVMTNNWFLQMISQVQEHGLPVYGLQDLQRFRYNTNSPEFNVEAGSGLDWFDIQVTVSWGQQTIALPELRRAILNRQTAVLLDDGTLGMIPEEWIRQYGSLMKMGREENGSLKVSKLHFSVLDKLSEQLGDGKVMQEIMDRKARLQNFDLVQTVAPSKAMKAELRPYQLAGFNWLQMLDEIGWGGCLADDMGLGKTLQTITFLQYLKEKKPGSTQLVICPTSLIFNWEREINKFCPELRYHTYYGTQRSFDDQHFEQFDVVLTSYGVMRMDIEHLASFKWEYVILDESQAIKNPQAQLTRSVQLLRCSNRLILSGTPVQNNTGDLYAQFNFLNPGLLGSYEFFRSEFSNPIDKKGDQEKTKELRSLIYPFMLRRTKEQVAKDLPDKTEVILWCTMDREQRGIYEEYKNYYRNMLLKKIDEEGMGRAGIYILEGLLKLRQICDHPRLLGDENNASVASVKADELLREITENTGDHKLLVFSQFTSMLAIIADELKKSGIEFCYLDGSTSARQRQKQVDDFQVNPEMKVFLISLKAGGVGLNLTAADYVYIVDPWWNPAAEQQAIDRTHRIGQTRKIFAYKMICRETVEEKILLLQDKKKALSDDLISEDTGFVKKLSRDDIEFLFS